MYFIQSGIAIANLKIFEDAVNLYQQQKFREAQALMQTCLQLNPSDAAARSLSSTVSKLSQNAKKVVIR